MSTRAESLPKSLVTAVLAMTLVVLGLGAAIVVIKLRPEPVPTTAVERGIYEWQAAVDANPKNDAALVGLGIALLDAGRTSDARDAFQKALELNDKNWMALLQLGLLVRDVNPTHAVDLLLESARRAPETNKVTSLVAAGDVLLEEGDLQGAQSAYQRAVADGPYVLEAHLGLAKSLEALGDNGGALEEYQKAAQFDPNNQEIADAIARLQGKD
jgi:tetratricopeptide (TPR) repeat protein